jgi:hypothetical protein
MQGLSLLTQAGMTILNGFGLTSMFQAFVGGLFFLALVGLFIRNVSNKS